MEPRRGQPKKHALVVNNAQRAELERMARQSRSARSIAFRARIVLECAVGAKQRGGGGEVAHDRIHCGPLAQPFHRRRSCGAGR